MRLFIGIPLDNTIQKQIYQKLIPFHDLSGFRFVTAENFHITIHFLGETIIDHSILAEQLIKVSDKIPSFEFSTQSIIGFPGNQKATSIGLSVFPKDPFIQMKNKIQKVLEQFGFSPGKSMIPHITIARMKHPVNVTDFQKKFGVFALKQCASSFVIFQSILQPAGPIYHRLETLTLKGERHG